MPSRVRNGMVAALAAAILVAVASPALADGLEPLAVGERVPDVSVRDVDGEAVSLRAAAARKPTVLIFYRGGWCPFCTRHLAGVQGVVPELEALGYQILAISPDRPEKIAEMTEGEELELRYTLLSDSKMDAARAFGLAFRVDAKTIEKYKGYGIDLVDASGEKHLTLPHPAVFIIDAEGTIRFAHAEADYKVRLAPAKIVAEAKKAAAGSKK